MLQKNKSHRVALLKYCLSAPLFALMLILSSATVNNSKALRVIRGKTQQVMLLPANGNATATNAVVKLNQATVIPGTASDQGKETMLRVTVKDTVPHKSDKVFTSVEKTPEFPGGFEKFYQFLSTNIKYPAGSREKKIQGKVIISFIVEEDGSLTSFRVARGVADDIDEEAVRVLKTSPKWIPGMQNGKTVRVAYTVPIAFTLELKGSAKPAGKEVGSTGDYGQDHSITIGSIATIVTKTDTGTSVVDLHLNGLGGKPLYLVDGKEVDNLTKLNPENIESISVLKDKSATALYGEKGASGVIVIKMKKPMLKLTPVKE